MQNMKTLEEQIKVMQAALDGKVIESSFLTGDWNLVDDIKWSWGEWDYRIKPEPVEPKLSLEERVANMELIIKRLLLE